LLIVLRREFNNEPALSGSRTSMQSTCSWTSRAPQLGFLSSVMSTFSCSKASLTEGLILQHSWNSLRC
jgi:hypothetical protein